MPWSAQRCKAIHQGFIFAVRNTRGQKRFPILKESLWSGCFQEAALVRLFADV